MCVLMFNFGALEHRTLHGCCFHGERSGQLVKAEMHLGLAQQWVGNSRVDFASLTKVAGTDHTEDGARTGKKGCVAVSVGSIGRGVGVLPVEAGCCVCVSPCGACGHQWRVCVCVGFQTAA